MIIKENLVAPQPEQPVEYDRARETSRRQSAVDLLLSLGYTFHDGAWHRQSAPKINILCETKSSGITGSTYLNVVRVDPEDDGSWTAVTDHWPQPTPVASGAVADETWEVYVNDELHAGSDDEGDALHYAVTYAVEDKKNTVEIYKVTRELVSTIGTVEQESER